MLSHLARNADSIVNLLIWARTGVETPQYASLAAREQGVSDGAASPVAELRADIAASAAALTLQADRLADADWDAEVRGLRGHAHPAWYSLWRRLTEVEIHHVDLDAGYGPGDWPPEFAIQCLARVAADRAVAGCPAVALVSTADGRTYQIGPAGAVSDAEVSGEARQLLAWLTGRASGSGLASRPGPLPALPSW